MIMSMNLTFSVLMSYVLFGADRQEGTHQKRRVTLVLLFAGCML